MALMALSDSENSATVDGELALGKNVLVAYNKSQSNLTNYKRGLAFVEERLVFYKKNEVMFYEQIVVLKRDITYKDSDISVLKCELEKLKKEKESNKLKLDKFENDSKSLDKLLGSQISDNSRMGVGFVSYNAVPPPPTSLFAPPTIDLSNSGLEEFQEPEFEGYGPKTSKSVSEVEPNKVRKNDGALIIEDWVSYNEDEVESLVVVEKKTVVPTIPKVDVVRPKQQENLVRKTVRSGSISLNTARQSHFNVVRTNRVNAVKASTCWVWRPIKPNSASITLKRYDYIDTELEDSARLNRPEDKKSMTEDINADWETRYAKEGNEINIIDGVMICFKEKI
ncbi:hypothetical protein Tco_0978278 [Tanacetum coccineum]|uniref:Uncharacterized protein n=1 Tax=Tanacetum coccineum TaxID=301880 RepID=A0ABQ5EMH2_9ASTR